MTIRDFLINNAQNVPINFIHGTNQSIEDLLQSQNLTLDDIDLSSFPISQFESLLGRTTHQTVTAIGYVIQFVFYFTSIIPFSFMILRFINFLSICTMYLFPNLKLTNYVRISLTDIFRLVRVSVFD